MHDCQKLKGLATLTAPKAVLLLVELFGELYDELMLRMSI